MLELMAALLMQAGEPPTRGTLVSCEVETDERGSRVRGITLDCPDDVHAADQLQAYADARVEPLQLRLGRGMTRAANAFDFVWSGDAWILPSPRGVVWGAPEIPMIAAERAVGAACAGRISVRPDGRPGEQDWYCLVSNPNEQGRTQGHFERASREAASNTRWLLPEGADSACAQLSFDFRWVHAEGLTTEAPEIPEEDVPACD